MFFSNTNTSVSEDLYLCWQSKAVWSLSIWLGTSVLPTTFLVRFYFSPPLNEINMRWCTWGEFWGSILQFARYFRTNRLLGNSRSGSASERIPNFFLDTTLPQRVESCLWFPAELWWKVWVKGKVDLQFPSSCTVSWNHPCHTVLGRYSSKCNTPRICEPSTPAELGTGKGYSTVASVTVSVATAAPSSIPFSLHSVTSSAK